AFDTLPIRGIENFFFDLRMYFEFGLDLSKQVFSRLRVEALQKLSDFLMILLEKSDRILSRAAGLAAIRSTAAAGGTFSRRWHRCLLWNEIIWFSFQCVVRAHRNQE